MTPYGMPAVTLPFCSSAIMFVLMQGATPRAGTLQYNPIRYDHTINAFKTSIQLIPIIYLVPVQLSTVTTPEAHLRRWREEQKHKNKPPPTQDE